MNILLKQLHRRLDHQEGHAGAGWQRDDEERGLVLIPALLTSTSTAPHLAATALRSDTSQE